MSQPNEYVSSEPNQLSSRQSHGSSDTTVEIAHASTLSEENTGAIAAAMALLDDEEKCRAARFSFDADRLRFITGRALVRKTLSRHVDVPPSDWRFSLSKYGRPRIAAPTPDLPLRFNASRSHDRVLCAVSKDHDIGADLERLRPLPVEVMRQFFAAEEQLAIERADADSRSLLFFAHWTLKEAYCKAIGAGLAIPLDQVVFRLNGEEAEVQFGPAIADRRENWRFSVLRSIPGYIASLCTSADPMPYVEVRNADTAGGDGGSDWLSA